MRKEKPINSFWSSRPAHSPLLMKFGSQWKTCMSFLFFMGIYGISSCNYMQIASKPSSTSCLKAAPKKAMWKSFFYSHKTTSPFYRANENSSNFKLRSISQSSSMSILTQTIQRGESHKRYVLKWALKSNPGQDISCGVINGSSCLTDT